MSEQDEIPGAKDWANDYLKRMKLEPGDIVTHTEDGGEYEILGTKGSSRTIYECKDITPDDEYPTWHQKKGGGAYTTRFVNGFLGEINHFHRKFLTLLRKKRK